MAVRRVAVVGGGITGLAAAHALAIADDPPEVVVLEADDRVGGKLRTGAFGGLRVELGADAFLARERAAVELCQQVGLGDQLVHQSARGVGVWWDGALRPLPDGVVLGVPTQLRPVATSGLVSPLGALRAGLDLLLPRRGRLHEQSIGEVVRRRLGAQVADRLVEPLLSGVYAGDIDRLSATAATPILADAMRDHRSLIAGLRARMRAARRARAGADGGSAGGGAGPAFVTLRGGLTSLAERLAATDGVEVRTGTRVESLGSSGLRLRTADGGADDLAVEAVVVATPAPAAARLLGDPAPDAAEPLHGIGYASVAVVVLVLPAGTSLPAGSGILVPRAAGRTVKAATWVSSKWDHVGERGEVVVRASVGRAGDDAVVDLPDAQVTDLVRRDLAEIAGIDAEPALVHVQRWRDALPQYEVGHEERVARVRDALADVPGVEIAGAALDGVGIPACVVSGQQAARRILG